MALKPVGRLVLGLAPSFCRPCGPTSFRPQRKLATALSSPSTLIHSNRNLCFRRPFSSSALQSFALSRRVTPSSTDISSCALIALRPKATRCQPFKGQPAAVHVLKTRAFTSGDTKHERATESLRNQELVQQLQYKLNQERQQRRYAPFYTFVNSAVGAIALTGLMSLYVDPYNRESVSHELPAAASRDIVRSTFPPQPPWLEILRSLENAFVIWMNLESARWTILFVAESLAWCCTWIGTLFAGADG